MATPQELWQVGQLGPAIQELTQQVKARPADVSQRVFLFELLCFEGSFDRADKQLDVIAAQSGGLTAELAVQVYRALIQAERVRQQVYGGDALPKFLLTPPAYADQ
jgi:type VI secretion system protein ImpE